MDFRFWLLGAVLSLLATFAHANALDQLTMQIYQFPDQAAEKIAKIHQNPKQLSATDAVRLQLLRCQLFIQQGNNQAAVEQSHRGQLLAINSKLDTAVPYFKVCEAEAFQNLDQIERALPLLDASLIEAKHRNDYQLLVSALRIRAQIENTLSNYAAAVEDLRLAMDIYPEIARQNVVWAYPPLAYVYADMASVLEATGDYTQAAHYVDLAKADSSAQGKIKHFLYGMKAFILIDQGKLEEGKQQLTNAISTLDLLRSDIEKAPSYAQIAAISLVLGDIKNADKYSKMATSLYQQLDFTTANIGLSRLISKIKFQQGKNTEALTAVDESIRLSKSMKQPFDISSSQELKAHILAQQQQYAEAYQTLTDAMAAYKLAEKQLSNTQFMQYKAKLSLQEQQQSRAQLEVKEASQQTEQRLDQAYALIYVLLGIIVMLLLWLLFKSIAWGPAKNKSVEEDSEKWAESMISSAKSAGYPLSLLMVNINQIKHIKLPQLQEELSHKLREQDKIIHHSVDKLLIVLPHTTEEGAERVVRQLEPVVNLLSVQSTSIGLAEMRQPDNLHSLIKRAHVHQLSRIKERGMTLQTPLA